MTRLNKFFTRFAAMRSNGPDPNNFMRCQALFWMFIWAAVAVLPAMQLVLGENFKFGDNTGAYVLVVSICGARFLLFLIAWIIKLLHYYEFLSEEVFQSFTWVLLFEGTLIGAMVYGKNKFFETKIIFE
jgi:hypothetical protein